MAYKSMEQMIEAVNGVKDALYEDGFLSNADYDFIERHSEGYFGSMAERSHMVELYQRCRKADY